MEDFRKYSCKERALIKYTNFGEAIEPRRWYQHDIDQIVYSTEFRKMQRKHQLISEKDPRCRSRMVHTLEVARIAKEISEKLNLDIELTEAIALSHDIGNSAYGSVSNKILKAKTEGIFAHEEASWLMLKYLSEKEIVNGEICSELEKNFGEENKIYSYIIEDYRPVNVDVYEYHASKYYTSICKEILDGVKKHGTSHCALTLEGQVVNFADNIAYLSQDIADMIDTKIWNTKEIKHYTYMGLAKEFEDSEKNQYKWEEINQGMDTDVRHVFSISSSERIGTLIKRFVEYNIKNIDKLPLINSEILGKSIPILQIDEGFKLIINCIWKYLEGFYANSKIMAYNRIISCKMDVLWDVLNDIDFTSQNQGYKRFYRRFEHPIFNDFFLSKGLCDRKIELWKKAFFIAFLSSEEISVIIDLYQQRDYTFELEL
ncbi:MAG: HD domain-containing protein [Lachnospiraceae bacterium]|jgi:putative nucleotidyltransferase with HDIG domain|nr:HD domain-containing protein [Lachnospiraceae bacterium]